jgi:hypothetical protein
MRIQVIQVDGLFRYRDASAQGSSFRPFNDDIKNTEDIKRYFVSGKHLTGAIRPPYNPPEIEFITDNGKGLRHYEITKGPVWYVAVQDYGQTQKIFTPEQIWSSEERLKFLREQARLPKQIETLTDAITFLSQREPEVIEAFEAELKSREQSVIPELCKAHAKEHYNAEASVTWKN